MYAISLASEFVAQHFLIGGDWGRENNLNSHTYKIEVTIESKTLDQHGYLLDIVEFQRIIDLMKEKYRDVTLNDLIEFTGINPSLEHFCRIYCEDILRLLNTSNFYKINVEIWEDSVASATYMEMLN